MEDRKDDKQLEPEEQTHELGESELDEISGGRGRNEGVKVCRNCGAKYPKVTKCCPICGSRASTIISFR